MTHVLFIQTIIDDNPKLTTRHCDGSDPLRLILDPQNRTPKKSVVYNDKNPALFFNKSIEIQNNHKRFIKLDPFNLNALMKYCFNDNIQSIIVEGGKKTIQNFIDANLWDESRVFTSNKKLKSGILSPKLNSEVHSSENFDGDKLNFYFN